MRSLKLAAVVLCFLLITLTPQSGGIINLRSIAAVIPSPKASEQYQDLLDQFSRFDEVNTKGKAVFEDVCSKCHTANLVLKSGLRDEEVTACITRMEAKLGHQIPADQRALIQDYLKYLLPGQ